VTARDDRGGARITLRHGAGGRAMRALIEELFVKGAPALAGAASTNATTWDVGLEALDDGAALRVGDRWLVVTTDSHVVHPIFFPGGDIGCLAVAGTVNDLAMMGATDVLGLTCGVIVEEGFAVADLARVQHSVARTCAAAGAPIVTGDTKVMGRGEIDGLVLNTTGLAFADRVVRDSGLRPGDRILVTGTVGDHGLAILATRNRLALDAELHSDVAPLNGLVASALAAGGDAVVAMKDPTRGGVASALHEMAAKSRVGVVLDEAALPLSPGVRAVSELLGIDPLQVANEGKALIGVSPDRADAVLAALHRHPLGRYATMIGTCIAEHAGRVILDTGFGRRLLTEPEGEPLPRIC
jgi:hydrogenase expression/formation protein HypE